MFSLPILLVDMVDPSSVESGSFQSTLDSIAILESSFPSTVSSSVSNVCLPPSTNHGSSIFNSENVLFTTSSTETDNLACVQHNNNTLGSLNSNPNVTLADTDGEVQDSLPTCLDFEFGSGGRLVASTGVSDRT